DGNGEVVAKASRDYPMINLRQGWAEQDPAEWWRATDEAIASLTASLPQGGREVTGIGLCGQMHGLTALDASGSRCATPFCGTTSGAPRSATGSPSRWVGWTNCCG